MRELASRDTRNLDFDTSEVDFLVSSYNFCSFFEACIKNVALITLVVDDTYNC